MSDEPDNLVLRCLRRLSEQGERTNDKLDEVIRRVGGLEQTVAHLGTQYAEVAVRMDKFERRLERIEHRLDLVEETHP